MLRRLVDIRQGELARVLLAFTILLLVVGAYTIVKAARDAVFLSRFGVTEISLVAIGLALLAGLVVALYLRATAGVSRQWLITGTNTLVAASLVALWAALRGPAPAAWLPWALYVWSSLFGVFIVMQFWLLASDLFDIREAKRLFGPVGLGAVVGGLAGGLLARSLAGSVGSPALLLVASGMLVAAAVLSHFLWARRRVEPPPKRALRKEPRTPLRELLLKPSYVRMVGLSVLLATIVTTLLDFQFKAIAKHEFAGRTDEMATFFGTVSAGVSGAAIVFQVVLTSWLLRRFGVGLGRALLPLILGLGCIAILGHGLLPVTLLTVVAAVKVADGSLRFTVQKAAMEITWLPVPASVREQGKSVVDTVVDRLGTGITGLLWLGLAALGLDKPDTLPWIAAAGIVLVAGWLLGLRRLHAAYLDAFRTSLARRTLDVEGLRQGLVDSAARRALEEALASDDAGQLCFAIYLLHGWPGQLPDLTLPVAHPDPAVRLAALELLTERGDDRARQAAGPGLAHPDPRVQEATIRYLRVTSLTQDDPVPDSAPPSASFAIDLVRLGAPATSAAAEARIRTLLNEPGPARLQRLHLMAAAPAFPAAKLLGPLLDDADPKVVEGALRAVGKAGAETLVPTLSRMLLDRRWRPRVLTALGEIGDPALGYLVEQLRDPTTPLDAKRALVQLAGASRRPAMAEELEALLGVDPPELSHLALRALSRLRRQAGVAIAPGKVERLTSDEITALYRDLIFLGRGSWPLARVPRDGEDLLIRSVREAVDARVGRIFRLLALRHDATDIRTAHRGVQSTLRSTRARSVEFLDNLLDGDHRDLLLPTLDDTDPGRLAATARTALGLAPENLPEALGRFLGEPCPWLRLASAWTVGERRIAEVRPVLEEMASSGDGHLAQVTGRALRRLDGDQEEPTMGLTVVEKALKLRTVDVLERASSEDLAIIAQIAEELELATEASIYARGDTPDALYVVVSGHVRLHQEGVEIGTVGAGEAFGSWALFDEAPRVASATTTEATTLLKVDREDFLEVLADRAEITRAVFQSMVERLRTIADLVKGS